jgi:hypothetical protein
LWNIGGANFTQGFRAVVAEQAQTCAETTNDA